MTTARDHTKSPKGRSDSNAKTGNNEFDDRKPTNSERNEKGGNDMNINKRGEGGDYEAGRGGGGGRGREGGRGENERGNDLTETEMKKLKNNISDVWRGGERGQGREGEEVGEER